MNEPLARFAPRWPIYATTALTHWHHHSTRVRRPVNDNWPLEAWQ